MLVQCRFVWVFFDRIYTIDMHAEAQKEITVYYENEIVGEFMADIIVENLVIVELKSVRRVIKAYEVQLVNYLAATGKDVGLILNFAEKGVEVKRKVRELDDLSA